MEKWDLDAKNTPKDKGDSPLPFLNVGTGYDISIKDLAILIADLMSYKGRILWDSTKPDGTPKKQLDVSRINTLGWHSKITLVEGLRQTIKLYKEEKLNIAN